jgi:hypothetical protein
MKSPLLCLCSLIALTQVCLAGGNTSLVEIDKVTEIKVEKNKITIRGSAVIKRRVMCTAEKADSTVFGQPAQWFHARVSDAIFEVVPYFTPGIQGVPTGGHSDAELKHLSDKWWSATHAHAAKIAKGDNVSIGYQGDQTTINGVQVTKIVGFGSVVINDERNR